MTRPLALVLLLFGGFSLGLVWLFDQQFASGEAYPDYSSERSDPMGAKVLYQSLAGLRRFEVSRNFQPLEFLSVRNATVLLLGISPRLTGADAERVEKLAALGNRVVVGLQEDDNYRQGPDAVILRRWGVKLPATVEMMEKKFGSGVLVVVPEGESFCNGSLARGDRTPLILRALGSGDRIVIDESHLGITESGSIVGLARRYRMQGFALGAALWVALFLWRSMSSFPPAAPAAGASQITGRTSASGLAALLRQNIPPSKLVATAWDLWLKSNPQKVTASRRAKAEALVSQSQDPLAVLAAVHSVLESKGPNDTRRTQDRA